MYIKLISGLFSGFILLLALSVGGCATDDMHDDGMMMKEDKMMKDDSMMKDNGMMNDDKMKDDEGMMKDSM